MCFQVQHQKILFVAQSILATDHFSCLKFITNLVQTSIYIHHTNSMQNHFRNQYRYGTTSIFTTEHQYMKNYKNETSILECFRFTKFDQHSPKFSIIIGQCWNIINILIISLKRSVRFCHL
ncbi:hypothetical protein ACTFIV_006982 [Dictyostelium citrinum]